MRNYKKILLMLFIYGAPKSIIAAPKNAFFQNVNVKNVIITRILGVIQDAYIQGNLTVVGKLQNASSLNYVTGPSTSTPNAIVTFADSSGSKVQNSTVLIDDSGNIQINGITKNGNTLSWPSIIGASGTFLGSDGSGNLVFSTPSGQGNVSTASSFSQNNQILVTDTLSGNQNIKSSAVTLDTSNNISGVNELTVNTLNATTINGNATSATNFTGNLAGDVSGTQSATQVDSVGGQTATAIANATVAANNATDLNIGNAIVQRNAAGNFSAGTITANLIGNVTGNISGSASTATSATNATTAVNFTGSLSGDVSGTQSDTQVDSVGGQTAADVASATIAANTATSNNTANTIVERDSSGNFSTNMISISGTPTNANDVVTKNYVDTAVTTGLEPKAPARVVSTSNVVLSGAQTIDGVLLNENDRVLLVNQTDPLENGLWLVRTGGGASGSWARPTDFAAGSTVGQAYVLITEGTVNAGTSWLASTPDAIIGTDPIFFQQFSIPGQTTAANVGTGEGQIFRDKTGITINLKTLAAGAHIILTNNTDDINIATDATSNNTPNTIVARDAAGNFSAGTITANLTGSASLNVLKSGDTMTGPLIIPAGSADSPSLKFSGSTNTGLSAPSSNTISFDTNGIERMTIGTSNITMSNRLLLQNILALQAIQSVLPTTNGSVTANSTTQILLLKHTSNITNYTVTFPADPVDGQLFTIMLGTTNTIGLVNDGNAASVVNAITELNPTTFTSSIGGTSVTYLYSAASNTWYRYSRG